MLLRRRINQIPKRPGRNHRRRRHRREMFLRFHRQQIRSRHEDRPTFHR